MRTSHKLTRLILALMSLVALAGAALAQQSNAGAVNPFAPNPGAQPENSNGIPVLPVLNMPMFPTPQPPGYRGNWNNENGLLPAAGGIGRAIGAAQADPPAQVQVSDQKLGSLLVFPYYTSSTSQANPANTWVTISNISTTAVTVHVFFIEGSGCTQADQFICLTANASIQLKASDFDPDIAKGWILAVAVGADGRPIQKNVLSGNAFVTAGNNIGNYGAESFTAYNNNGSSAVPINNTVNLPNHAAAFAADPSCRVKLVDDGAAGEGDYVSDHGYNGNGYIPGLYTLGGGGTTATLNFSGPPTFCSATDTNKEPGTGNQVLRTFQLNGGGYDFVPNRFAVEIQSPQDVPGQMIITVGLNGDVSTGAVSGARQVGTGTVVNGNETPFGSFVNFILGGCQAMGTIDNNNPRVPRGMNALIPSGQVGTMQFSTGPAVGIVITPRGGAKATSGIRTLHKTNVNTGRITSGTYNVSVANAPGQPGAVVIANTATALYGTQLTIPVFIPPACPPVPGF
ncbi:MAG: hypothetical protein JST84_03935 [Acidobacteria bacterium]|nr:hypothetical protein [Acidobacteriota bacterium]